MRRFFTLYITKWYIPPLIAGVVGLLGLVTLLIQSKFAFYSSLGIPFFALLASGLTGIAVLFKKRFVDGILVFLSTFLLGYVGFRIVSPILMIYPYDFYAVSLKIPYDVTVHLPKDTLIDGCNTIPDFELYTGEQPGIYYYTACLPSTYRGTIFLKAFEVTHNEILSVYDLEEGSRITIEVAQEDNLYKQHNFFTIYEGDWGDFYAARFELWFQPANDRNQQKLAEKIYKIQGWQR